MSATENGNKGVAEGTLDLGRPEQGGGMRKGVKVEGKACVKVWQSGKQFN